MALERGNKPASFLESSRHHGLGIVDSRSLRPGRASDFCRALGVPYHRHRSKHHRKSSHEDETPQDQVSEMWNARGLSADRLHESARILMKSLQDWPFREQISSNCHQVHLLEVVTWFLRRQPSRSHRYVVGYDEALNRSIEFPGVTLRHTPEFSFSCSEPKVLRYPPQHRPSPPILQHGDAEMHRHVSRKATGTYCRPPDQ